MAQELLRHLIRYRHVTSSLIHCRRISQTNVCFVRGRGGGGGGGPQFGISSKDNPTIFFNEDEHPRYNQSEIPEEEFEDAPPEAEKGHEFWRRRRFLRMNTPRSPCLITWAGCQQIKYLHKQDPDHWSAERVSEAYPISVNDAQLLITSSSVFRGNPTYIAIFDRKVLERWKALETGKGAGKEDDLVTPEQRTLYAEGQLRRDRSGLNTALPVPPPIVPFILPPPRPGPFSRLIKTYIDQKEEKERIELEKRQTALPLTKKSPIPDLSAVLNTTDHTAMYQELLPYSRPPPTQVGDVQVDVLPSPGDLEPDMRLRAPFARRNREQQRVVMHGEVRERIESRAENINPEVGRAFKDWFGRFDQAEMGQKQSATALRARQEQNVREGLETERLPARNASKPWQQQKALPIQQEPDFTERIKVPAGETRENVIYRKGNAFYSNTGEFLYSVPG